MPIPEELQAYAMRLGFPQSENLAQIFSILFPHEDEIKLVAAMPGTIKELAEKTGFPEAKVKSMVDRMMELGAVGNPMHKPDLIRLFPAMIELRDSTVLNPNAPTELFLLWDKLISEEMKQLKPLLENLDVPPMVRVVPVERSVETQQKVLDIDSARYIFKNAELITAVPCACRTQAKKVGKGLDCPAPETSVCMQTNGFAQAILRRKVGSVIDNAEALKRIGDAEDAGLVHVVRNNVKDDMFMCNCCSCCCTGLFLINQVGYVNAYARSRFQVKVEVDSCSGCGTCETRCQFHAIKVGDVAEIDYDRCFGCGNCVIACPEEALVLEEVRPKEFIRIK